MRKILLIFCISLLLITGCKTKKINEGDNEITEDVIEVIDNNDLIESMPEEKQSLESNEEVNNEIIESELTTNNKPIISETETKQNSQQHDVFEHTYVEDNYIQNIPETETKIEEEQNVSNNTPDPNSFNYSTHKGRIDCSDESDCMSKSLAIQKEFIGSIVGSQYVDVKNSNNELLGYFIAYEFEEKKYSTDEKCNEIGNKIKNKLSDRVVSFKCTDSILKIYTNY